MSRLEQIKYTLKKWLANGLNTCCTFMRRITQHLLDIMDQLLSRLIKLQLFIETLPHRLFIHFYVLHWHFCTSKLPNIMF